MAPVSFTAKLGRQIVAAVVMTIVGFMLALLLRSSGDTVSAKRDHDDIQALAAAVKDINENGPAVIRVRLDQYDNRMGRMENKLDDVYSSIVLHQGFPGGHFVSPSRK